MSSNETQSGSALDNVLILLAVLVLGGAIGAFYYFETQFNVAVRVGGLLIAVAAAVAILMQSQVGKTMWSYVRGSRVELRKVVWPTRRDSVQTTLLIFVVVLLLGAFLYGVDAVLLWGVKALTGRGEA
ncbi:preprotein translocase subunit SecE [Abyssibacter sp.]|jgi:preprotein translocase subunit SecE|uniref:preprotein translocase subunit SecE n=1 Tax=Abyssibacter sp. TaxID=2320200 RepID=UPI0025BCC8AD|nr:preprotein translocase subunit SecE [Abyssibacter sp.]MCK5858811.1 preprotein translocase subunit SecE [Abyssibacter sp.]